jgi:hypothetical protein
MTPQMHRIHEAAQADCQAILRGDEERYLRADLSYPSAEERERRRINAAADMERRMREINGGM